MLARLGEPFDSDEHLFEIKWDGTRAICFRDARDYRLQNRRQFSQKERYPDLAGVRGLKAGTVLDGEIVMFREGRPDFELMLRREQAQGVRNVAAAARSWPATYIVFDLLYDRYVSQMSRPCSERRDRLREVVAALGAPNVVMSEGVTGQGIAYFEQASQRELEGVVAKRLSSPYLPGQRSDHWIKFKRRNEMVCAIIGCLLDEHGAPRSLIIAAEVEGELRCVGKVGSGLTERTRRELRERIQPLLHDRPILPCDFQGQWLKPGLFCKVSYLEISSAGQLRAPVFQELIEPGETRS